VAKKKGSRRGTGKPVTAAAAGRCWSHGRPEPGQEEKTERGQTMMVKPKKENQTLITPPNPPKKKKNHQKKNPKQETELKGQLRRRALR